MARKLRMIVPPNPITKAHTLSWEDDTLWSAKKPKSKDWNQVEMVELYEDLCNSEEQDFLEIEIDVFKQIESEAHKRGESVNRFIHHVIVPYALKVVEEHERSV